MGANRQTLRLRFVIKTMSAAVAHVPHSILGFSVFFDRDHLDTHRHCLLAIKTTDHLSEIDHFGDVGIFSRYFPNQFAHDLPPHTQHVTSLRLGDLKCACLECSKLNRNWRIFWTSYNSLAMG